MRRWLTKNRETVIPGLVVVVLGLSLAILLKYGMLTRSRLEDNKEALAALNYAVGILVVVFGGVLSYYRFFRGRTFVARAEPELSVQVLPTTDDFNIHAVTLRLKNIGNLPIWDPVPRVEVHREGPDGSVTETWEEWVEAEIADQQDDGIAVVDPGESVSFINHVRVPTEVWAVSYIAFFRGSGGQVWKCSATTSNIVQRTGDEEAGAKA